MSNAASTEAPNPIVDNDQPWVAEQIREYLETDGERPIFKNNAPLLLLTTKGRASGTWRRTCLIYGPHDGAFVIVASRGGTPTHPAWYLNLREHPRVWLNVGAEAFWATARVATPEEKPELWAEMVAIYPEYADYQEKTTREIPVVVLERE